MKNEDLNIDQVLGKIERVKTPPFILTRIETQLSHSNEVAPFRWSLAYFSIAMIVLLLNVLVVFNFSNNQNSVNPAVTELASSLNMNSSNQLYYEQD
ncbi:MAG: hypothetical protein ACPGD5_03795 [Salibacteraceae bacterium]